jgi:glycosyltransferase involved in cell wall biosynthesis
LNEEMNLPRCLDSLQWCGDVVVLDSFSSDGTEKIAKERGARFVQRQFDDYASQRNYGLNGIEYKHEWIFMVDADETVSKELADEIESLPDDASVAMYRLRRKDFLMGKWIRRSSGYPTWFGRLMRKGKVRVERAINEEYHTDGGIAHLNNHFFHYPFNKGFHDWFEKHNRYSTMEAQSLTNGEAAKLRLRDLFVRDPVLRRKAIKNIVYRLPGRPVLMFCALYFVRLGFLDGAAGLRFCILRSFYEYMISCKMKEIQLRNKGFSV